VVAGIIALKESADKAPALTWLMWGYHLDLVGKLLRRSATTRYIALACRCLDLASKAVA
jgi:hypothetical protein